jgi:hypothetical protein
MKGHDSERELLVMPGAIRGEVSIFDADNPTQVYLRKKNIIVNGVSFLFARLLANNNEPLAGVWGLAVGQGGTGSQGWSSSQQPDPTATQIAMVSEVKRKQLTSSTYLDSNGNPTSALTTSIQFLTVLNATTDGISVPLREMGLIGGGTSLEANGGPTNMLTAPYFNPASPADNTILLINYVTLPPLILPPGVNFGIAWVLSL